MADKSPTPYKPSDAESKAIALVNDFFEAKKQLRQVHESTWYVNAAMVNGQQTVSNLPYTGKSEIPPTTQAKTLIINRIFPKVRARMAKFLKGRPVPIVVPPTPDREDVLNARATQKALDYAWRKFQLEIAYREALQWASIASKGFWHIYWDPKGKARIKVDGVLQEVTDGDIGVEVCSPYEIFPDDPTKPRLAHQRRLVRARMVDIEAMKLRYPEKAEFFVATADSEQAFQYERQIAALSSRGAGNLNLLTHSGEDNKNQVLVKEFFERPTEKYPDGRYILVVGDVLVKDEPELPYGLADQANPFPFVEFADTTAVGRFWPTTVVEQLTDPQKEYNGIRTRIREHLKLMLHPKILAPRQAQIAEGAWVATSGEIVEYTASPGMQPPQVLAPPNVSSDTWRALELLREEFDSITQIYPSSEGQVGGAESGFQTNLLQEAADAAHAPDIRQHELAIEEAAFKIRRLMKRGYSVPRLITAIGKSYLPEVFEFSSDNIDENAEVIVQAGSGLPMLKGARIQGILELWDRGILGAQDDPEAKRRALDMLEIGGLETAQKKGRTDEELAKWETQQMSEGVEINPPQFYENHHIHFGTHTDDLKSPESQNDPPEVRMLKIAHVILHMKFFDPLAAYNLSMEYGLEGLIPPPPPPMPGGAPGQGPAPGPGGPPPGGPPPPPPGP